MAFFLISRILVCYHICKIKLLVKRIELQLNFAMHLILYNPYTFFFDHFHEKEYSSSLFKPNHLLLFYLPF